MSAARHTHSADLDLQVLIDNAPRLDDDQRHGLRELLRPAGHFTARTARLPIRAQNAPSTEAA